MKKNILPVFLIAFFCSQVVFPHGDHAASEEAAIRLQRETSNQAIANRDVGAIIDTLMPDYHVVTAANLQLSGHEAQRKMIAKVFTEFPDASYTRTTDTIQINVVSTEAAETGNWIGNWTKPNGSKVTMGGSYFAKWRKIEGSWLLQAEVFVAL